jgi:hypothetical protein
MPPGAGQLFNIIRFFKMKYLGNSSQEGHFLVAIFRIRAARAMTALRPILSYPALAFYTLLLHSALLPGPAGLTT